MIWPGGTGIKDAAASFAMQILTGGLELWPSLPARPRGRKVVSGELGGRGEICDVVHGDRPAPQVARHPVCGRQCDLGEYSRAGDRHTLNARGHRGGLRERSLFERRDQLGDTQVFTAGDDVDGRGASLPASEQCAQTTGAGRQLKPLQSEQAPPRTVILVIIEPLAAPPQDQNTSAH